MAAPDQSAAPERGRARRWRHLLGGLVALPLLALLVTQLPAFGARPSGERVRRAERSGHYADGAFVNLEPTNMVAPGKYGELLWRQLFGDEQREPPRPLPVAQRRASEYATAPASGLRATWIGHASVLLEISGLRVLTDPTFSQRCSPFSFAGPARFFPPPIALSELPKIDAVVISHDHYDHLDMSTIQTLAARGTHFYVPLGIGAHLERWGVSEARIHDLDWYEHASLDGVRFVATPARHYSGRGLLGGNATLWASWVIASDSRRVFFSGDSGYSRVFAEIGARFGPFDLTLIKIGASDPLWQEIHMSAEEAVRTHVDVRGKLLLPIHWGTFNLAYHAWNEPPERALAEARRRGAAVVMPRPGEWVDVLAPTAITPWWR